ncbi:hypothetical protein BDR04DRAFT_1092664 [Suillus decipiens]|nr:hypothetical protein BDR04DRAFT_1092664 [Suillus decipiens]
MRFSILAAVVSLTASMYVSACIPNGSECSPTAQGAAACCSLNCGSHDDDGYWSCV